MHRPWFASNRGSSRKYGRIARFLVHVGTAAQSASPLFSLSGPIAHDFQLERTIAWSQAWTDVIATIAAPASAASFIFASLPSRRAASPDSAVPIPVSSSRAITEPARPTSSFLRTRIAPQQPYARDELRDRGPRPSARPDRFCWQPLNILVRETLGREVPHEIPAAARLRDAFETC